MARSYVLPFLSVLSLLQTASAHDASAMPNGVVGYGIDLYGDLCCQTCHDVLSPLWLNCTTFPEGYSPDMGDGMHMVKRHEEMDMNMPETSDDCRVSNEPWLQSMAYCIQENCRADNYPEDKQAIGFSTWALMGLEGPPMQDSLPASAPTEELAGDAMWLNSTMLANGELYYTTHGTYKEFGRSERYHTKYSLVVYLFTIGFVIVCGLFVQARGLFTGFQKTLYNSAVWAKLQSFIILPALTGGKRHEPLAGKTGYVPGRGITIFLVAYTILNVILSAVSFGSFQPNIYWSSRGMELCEYVGNRTGTLSFVNMGIAILFAGRNNLLINLTGWSQTTFLTLHRWTARMATLQAVVHSIVYTLQYWQPGNEGYVTYAAKAADPFFWWGIIATIAMCLILGFSILWFRVKLYETFLVLHIALAILALIGCWYHIIIHFEFAYGYQVWLYLAFAFWAFDRFVRFARIAIYNRPGRSTALVEQVPGSDVMHITLFPQLTWGWGPGQHSFLYFPHIGAGRFWESHPFSVAAWTGPLSSQRLNSSTPDSKVANTDAKTADIDVISAHPSSNHSRSRSRSREPLLKPDFDTRAAVHFLVRTHTGLTATLRNELFSNDPRPAEISVYNEGPYGGHRASLQPLFAADTIVCLVGGIGITNALGFVQEYMSGTYSHGENPHSTRGIFRTAKRFVLLWSAKEMGLINHVKERFLTFSSEDTSASIETSFWCTATKHTPAGGHASDLSDSELEKDESAIAAAGRLCIRDELRKYAEKDHQTAVVVCGPSQMADEATREIVSCIRDGYRVDLVEEAFSW